MARVRSVIAASMRFSSSSACRVRMSTNTGTAPRSTKALAVETKVYDGMMTSSPGPTSARMAAISRADETSRRDCYAVHLPEAPATSRGEGSVPGKVAGGDGVLDVRQLGADGEWLVERNA